MSDVWQVTSDRMGAANAAPAPAPYRVTRHLSLVTRRAFSLIELLVVIAIMGIMASLAVPALKNFGRADAMIAADQQMLNDVARARQLAISQRTTVYMVFVPTNFWGRMTPAQSALLATTNLCDKQLTGYTFAAYGGLGDQPGQHQWHFLASWQSLPDGTFIAPWKFYQTTTPFTFKDPISPGKIFSINTFDYTNGIPFPTETNLPPTGSALYLPYIAFNYLGQLVSSGNDNDFTGNGQDIPLARGIVAPAADPATKGFLLNTATVAENPPGNSTNTYNVIHIDPLTGRATLQEPKLQ